LKERVEDNIKWEDFAVVHVVPNLPADAAVGMEYSDTFADNGVLLIKISLEGEALLVFLAEIVGRRRDDELDGVAGDLGEKIKATALE